MSELHPVELVAGDVRLRELAPTDLDAAFDFGRDEECFRYLPVEPVSSRAEERAFLDRVSQEAHSQPRRQWQLAITVSGGDELLGMVRIGLEPGESRSASVGYGVRRRYWGRGIASEAARLIVSFGFEQLHLHRIWATYDAENAASGAVLRKIGMTIEGRLRHHRYKNGAWRDSIICSILEHERTGAES